MDILHHFELHPLFHLELFGLDISINKAVIMMWIVGLILVVFLSMAARAGSIIPKGPQNFIEPLILFIRDGLVKDVIGPNQLAWFPFIATLFFFVLVCNLVGLVPGSFTVTSNVNVTGALALIVFFAVQITGVRKHGLIKYCKGFVPSGLPIVISIAMVPIELIGIIAKPFSLAVRLFANMFAGHAIILVFLFLIISFKSYVIAIFPLAGVVLMSGLEIGFSFIQAYIFAILSAMYISAAVHLDH